MSVEAKKILEQALYLSQMSGQLSPKASYLA
jgi:hypothetical protein